MEIQKGMDQEAIKNPRQPSVLVDRVLRLLLTSQLVKGRSMSVGRHQAFEFFKPVENDVDLVLLRP